MFRETIYDGLKRIQLPHTDTLSHGGRWQIWTIPRPFSVSPCTRIIDDQDHISQKSSSNHHFFSPHLSIQSSFKTFPLCTCPNIRFLFGSVILLWTTRHCFLRQCIIHESINRMGRGMCQRGVKKKEFVYNGTRRYVICTVIYGLTYTWTGER